MSMVIGTNISSLTAQRHLENSRADLEQSMERLSSGSRINSASDDAAGLAIRDRMDSQVNGLSQAVRNASDAISMGQTAEGSLEESTAILQRMRDLSVQAVGDTNTAADRTALQSEVTQLQAELTRIGNKSTFNNTKLLDGTYTDKSFQIGHSSGETIDLSITDMRAEKLAVVAATVAITAITAITASAAVAATATHTFTSKAVATDKSSITVGSATLEHTFVAGDFVTPGDETVTEAATAYTAAWNASADSAVAAYTASSSAGVVTFTQDAASDGALTTSNSHTTKLQTAGTGAAGTTGVAAVATIAGVATITIVGATEIAGELMTATVGDATFAYATVAADFADGASATKTALGFKTAWNASTDVEVAKYAATVTSGVITFTQEVGVTGTVAASMTENSAGVTDVTGASGVAGVTAVAAVAGTSTLTFTEGAESGSEIKVVVDGIIDADLTFTFGDANFAINSAGTVTETAAAYAAAWEADNDYNVSLLTASSAGAVVTFTQGVAADGAYTVAMTDNKAATHAGTSAVGVTGELAVTGRDEVTGVTGVAETNVSTIDISTEDGATKALTALDTAITQVGTERANLGAFQNRLEHTVSNLQSMIENTSAARSRIADADFATESANLAKNQVLQQAGTAMLAQANASTQNVLSLLK